MARTNYLFDVDDIDNSKLWNRRRRRNNKTDINAAIDARIAPTTQAISLQDSVKTGNFEAVTSSSEATGKPEVKNEAYKDHMCRKVGFTRLVMSSFWCKRTTPTAIYTIKTCGNSSFVESFLITAVCL